MTEVLQGVERVHMVGIGGAGMSALAALLADMGFEVSGCDVACSDYDSVLSRKGITHVLGHSPSHIETFAPQLVVYSSAISPDQEELETARRSGISVVGRGLLLSRLFNSGFGVGVAGAHGKTTTSSMIGMILERAGLSPTFFIGAELRDIGTNAVLGHEERGLFVAEIDESDGSFEFFHPSVTVITNVDWDHVDHFHERSDMVSAFARFASARKPDSPLVVCMEDEGGREVARRCSQGVVTYGWGGAWNWGAFDVNQRVGGGVDFAVMRDGVPQGRLDLSYVSGGHNVLNALAACAAAAAVGVPWSASADALKVFKGARHRLEKVGEKQLKRGGMADVVDDYAHHPTEIRATLSALRGIYPNRRIVAVFQPHRYSRTSAFSQLIAGALLGADAVLLLPVYSAGEAPIPDADSESIAAAMRRESSVCQTEAEAFAKLDAILRDGDVLVTLGAGSVTHFGESYIEKESA
ncbi:MAG: UDP-N-acetylmuramate--L-alanine ligase [Synergistaceae bacterium]|jgi:UDP-N-acetylmuramate--alanine ligase|nr:UDP-N-acetylmuramate--L-alanine ligase [Synergistaceae bacterium]